MKTIQEHITETRLRNQKIQEHTKKYRWHSMDTQTRKKRIYISLSSNIIILLMVLSGLWFFSATWLYSMLALLIVSIFVQLCLLYHA